MVWWALAFVSFTSVTGVTGGSGVSVEISSEMHVGVTGTLTGVKLLPLSAGLVEPEPAEVLAPSLGGVLSSTAP